MRHSIELCSALDDTPSSAPMSSTGLNKEIRPAMVTETKKETLVAAGQFMVSNNAKEILKATRIATSIAVVVYDEASMVGGLAHMALPDSKMVNNPGESPLKYVDLALPKFIEALCEKGFSKTTSQVKIIGGSQLFNFGGGGGNILNIGTRNAITARTILTREGIQVEKTETGGNKPRTVTLDIDTGEVLVFHPGETPRSI